MITVAQVGVGYWGPNLLRNLVAHQSFKVQSVVDICPERRDFVKRLYPYIVITDDINTVLNDENIQALVIATPVNTHYELTMKALQAGKHVLVEKPLATTVAEIEDIQRVAAQHNVVVMAGHTFLYNAAVRYLKEAIDSGELGKIRYIYSQRLNLGRIRSDVDALWNFGPHDVSIIQFLLGNPKPVSINKQGMDYVQPGVDDVVFLDIVYPNKIMAHIHVSWLDPNKTRRMTVVGSKKMIVYDDLAENKITIYDKGIDRMAVLGENMIFDTPDFFTFNHRIGDVILPKINFEEPLKVEISHFYDCIEGNIPCLTGPEHALSVVEILTIPQYALSTS